MTSHELIVEIERLQYELEKLGISSFLVTANLGELAGEINEHRCPDDELEWLREQLEDEWNDLENEAITGLERLGRSLYE